jgi:hypothetical protein
LPLVYDYTAARADCEAKGLRWLEDIVPDVDKRFAELNLSQQQVDGVMQLHAHYVGWLFTPQTYRPWHRVLLALHFLFGRGAV